MGQGCPGPQVGNHGTRGIARIRLAHEELLILSCYISPKCTIEEFKDYLDRIETMAQAHRGNIIVAGDFNSASTLWGSDETTGRGSELEETLARCGLFLANEGDTPTWHSRGRESFIDITTTNAPMSIASWRVVDNDRSGSDHLYIEFDLQSNVPDSGTRRPLFSRLDREALVKSIDEQCKNLVD